MARRRRRRRVFRNRVSPDRAWLIVEDLVELAVTEVVSGTLEDQSVPLMTFEEITNDEAALSKEDSDWFVQRLLIDWIPNMGSIGASDFRYAKAYEHIIFTMNNRLRETTEQPVSQSVITDDIYNRAARVLHTGVNPIHVHYNPRITTQGTQAGAQAVDAGGDDNTIGTAGVPWLGTEMVSLDLNSKFALKEDTNLYMAIGPFWKDSLWANEAVTYNMSCIFKARILVQRKRMR